MKTTWILLASAISAVSAGSAVAASSAEAHEPQPEPAAHVAAPSAPAFDLAAVPPAPAVGDDVPADAVAATRELGLSVFVSPAGDGSGLVIDPWAPLPPAIVAEIDLVNAPLLTQDIRERTAQLAARGALRTALDRADATVLVLSAIPSFDDEGNVVGLLYGIVGDQGAPLEFATSHEVRSNARRDMTVATWGPFLADHPEYTVVDTTAP